MNADEKDGLYGDVNWLLFSVDCGAEDLYHRLKSSVAHDWLSRYSGPTEAAPREPTGLPAMEPEEDV